MKSLMLNRCSAKAFDATTVIRHKASHECEIKLEEADGETPGRVKGYASKFGLTDSYNEIVQPGAFKKSVARLNKSKAILPILWQHDSDIPIGGWDTFKEDDVGLYLEGTLDLDTQAGKEAYSAVLKRYVSGLSIGYFEVKADPWSWDNKEPRKLYELDLRETSVVTFPALKEAQLDAVKAMRATGEFMPTKDFRAFIQKELGLTEAQAARVCSEGYDSLFGEKSKDTSQSLDLGAILPPLAFPTLA